MNESNDIVSILVLFLVYVYDAFRNCNENENKTDITL